MREGDICNRRVEEFHERRQCDGYGNEPRIYGGLLLQHARPPAADSVDVHGWLDRHTGPQQMFRILIFIEPNSHGESLDHFYVVPGRIFGRKQAEERTSGTGKALDLALVVMSERVDAGADWLSGSHPFELDLFKVRCDPNIVQGNDHEQALS